jgi:peptide/nickel transport system substrate-binding protein
MCGASAVMAQTLRIGLEDDIGTLDPHRSLQMVDRMVFASMCDSLIAMTPNMELVPKLATSWTVSPDGKKSRLNYERALLSRTASRLTQRQLKPISIAN